MTTLYVIMSALHPFHCAGRVKVACDLLVPSMRTTLITNGLARVCANRTDMELTEVGRRTVQKLFVDAAQVTYAAPVPHISAYREDAPTQPPRHTDEPD